MKSLLGQLKAAATPFLGKSAPAVSASPFAPLRAPGMETAKSFAPLAPAAAPPKAMEPVGEVRRAAPVKANDDQEDEEPCFGVIWGWKPWSFSATAIRVARGSVGERMGILPGDILLGLDGHSLVRVHDLRRLGFKIGQKCQLEVSSRGRTKTLECVLEPWPDELNPTQQDKDWADRNI